MCGIGAKNDEVCVVPLRDAATVLIKSETPSGVRRQRRENLLIAHASSSEDY